MKKMHEPYFLGPFVPEWISMSAAFSYLLAIIKIDGDQDDTYAESGVIDVTSPCKSYKVPDKDELMDIDRKGVAAKKYLKDIDLALFARFAEGTIACQGRKSETCRQVECTNSPYYMHSRTVDKKITAENYEPINRSFWKDERPWINYKDASVLIWEDDPENVHELEDYKDNGFMVTGMQNGDSFVWREEWVDLQVCTSDLLESTEKQFGEFVVRVGGEVEKDPDEVMTRHYRNRFFYSKAGHKWIVEFEGKPFCIEKYKQDAIDPLTVQYLLKHGSTNIEKALEMCEFLTLETNISPILSNVELSLSDQKILHDIYFNEDSQAFHNEGNFSQKILDKRGLGICLQRIVILEKELDKAVDILEKEDIKRDIKEIKDFLDRNTFNGKSKLFSDRDSQRVRVNSRMYRVKSKVPDEASSFREHLEKYIKLKGKGYVYVCDQSWDTEDK